MKILVSPISVEEAYAVAEGGADIVDIKNVGEGSLGASFPWVIRDIVASLRDRDIAFSATLGDLSFKPGTASLAALGAAVCGVRYIKAGLHGVRCYEEALALMRAVVRSCREYDPTVAAVAAGYADYRRFSGLSPEALVEAARDAGADLVLLDTAVKDGRGLFEALSLEAIEGFVRDARASDLGVGLAGSLRLEHVGQLQRLGPDVVGVRGAVCRGHDRTSRVDRDLVREFVSAVKAPLEVLE